MKPLKIHLENFLSYGREKIDLSGLQLAALLGDNGAGKSTLATDAVTWPLFGKGRYSDVDRYIRQGQEQAVAELQFALAGEIYRVIRTRSNKGKGKSTLELAKLNCSEWIPLSGTTIRETEAKIAELLRMDYETFVSSCVILQGQADRFTRATSGERMAVFSQILGLDVYIALQEAARNEIRNLKIRVESLRARLDAIAVELAGKSGLENREIELMERVETLARDMRELEAQLEKQEMIVSDLNVQASRGDDLRDRLQQADLDLGSLQKQLTAMGQKRDRLQQIVNHAEDIRSKAAELEQVRQQITVLKTMQPMLAEARAQENRIDSDHQLITATINKLSAQINSTRSILAGKEMLEQAAADYQKAITDLEAVDVLAEEWQTLDAQTRDARATWERADTEFKTSVRTLEKELSDLKARSAMLEDSRCIDPERAACRFLADAQQAKARIPQVQAEYEALDHADIKRLEKAWHDLEAQQVALGYDNGKRQRLRDKITELRPRADQATHMASKTDMLQSLQEQWRDADERQAELADRLRAVQQKTRELDSELTALPAIEERAKKLEQWAKVLPELEQAETGMKEIAEQAEILTDRTREKAAEKTALEGQLQDLDQVNADLRSAKHALSDLKFRLSDTREKHQGLTVELGKVHHILSEMKKKAQEKNELENQGRETAREQHFFEQLAKAFGRTGIPALITENSLPEVEALANDLLARLTGSRITVRFETQRETKTTGTISETLDIVVSDELGERPYEGWSGAEKFETDLAIRLAISKFLARRAGAKIELLVCDEGASCLDQQGRTAFTEAINIIAEDFSIVIVVTHIDELKESFPQQIVVRKTPEGSKVEVVS